MFISLDEFFKKEIILSNIARDFTAEFKEIKSYLENFSEIGLIKASVKDNQIIVFDGVFRVVALGVLYGASIQTNSFLSKKYIQKYKNELNKLNLKLPKDKKLFILNTSEDEFIKSINLCSNNSDYLKLIDDLNLSDYRKIIEHYKGKKGDYRGELKKLFLGVIKAVYKMNYQIGEKIEHKDMICKIINKNYQKNLNYKLTNHIGKLLKKVDYDLARFCVDNEWLDVINNVYRKDLAGVLRAIYGGGEFKANEIIEQNKRIKELDGEFKNEIKKAKNHWYLDGRVGFLLDMSGRDLAKFKEYFRIFCIIFGNNPYKGDKHKADSKKMGGIINIKDKNGCEMLFRRALLTKGNYLKKEGEYYYFIKFGSEPYQKEKNFFYVFNNHQVLLKELFDELLDSKDIEDKLRQMIDDFSDTNDFRYQLITEPKHIKNLKLHKNKIYKNEKHYYII